MSLKCPELTKQLFKHSYDCLQAILAVQLLFGGNHCVTVQMDSIASIESNLLKWKFCNSCSSLFTSLQSPSCTGLPWELCSQEKDEDTRDVFSSMYPYAENQLEGGIYSLNCKVKWFAALTNDICVPLQAQVVRSMCSVYTIQAGSLLSLKNLKLKDLSFLAVRFEFEDKILVYLFQSKIMFLIFYGKQFTVQRGLALGGKGYTYIHCDDFGPFKASK